jgi:hypothetical protein
VAVSGDLTARSIDPSISSAIAELRLGWTIERSYRRPMRRARGNRLCMTLPATAGHRSRYLAFTRFGLRETRAAGIRRTRRRTRPRWRRSSQSYALPGQRRWRPLREVIVILWRAGLRIGEALDLAETDLDGSRGSVLARCPRKRGVPWAAAGCPRHGQSRWHCWLPRLTRRRSPALVRRSRLVSERQPTWPARDLSGPGAAERQAVCTRLACSVTR